MAIEVREAFSRHVQGVDLTPCAQPPHKDASTLLPFDLRADMVEESIKGIAGLRCNRLESLRTGPSYTWDTLEAYSREHAGHELFFILGSQDYALLPTWHKGLELSALCNFIVIPRGTFSPEDFSTVTRTMWPQASPRPSAVVGSGCIDLPGGTKAHYLRLPRLDVSSSYIRSLWLAGRDIACLVPEAARELLERNREAVRTCWSVAAAK
jgi:nicotinate-nucleotide adenylyltransferase